MNAPTTPVQPLPQQTAPELVLPASLTPAVPRGCFGLFSARLALRADATLDDVLEDALVLLDEGLRLTETAVDAANVAAASQAEASPAGFGAVWALRQARMLIGQAQVTRDQATAAAAAGWRVKP